MKSDFKLNQYSRFYAPDLAKALGILLVVIGHVIRGLDTSGKIQISPIWQSVDHAIYLFHMPLFFYISGAFFYDICQKLKYSLLFKRYISTLIYPLIIWSYITFGMQYLASSNTNSHVSISDVIWSPLPPKQHFWFLGVLFLMCISVGRLCTLKKGFAIISTLFALTSFVSMFGITPLRTTILDLIVSDDLGKFIGQIFTNIPFFLLGILFSHKDIFDIKFNLASCVLTFCLSLSLYQIFSSTILLNDIVHFITAVLCVLSIYKFCCEIEKKADHSRIISIVAFIGMNSMIIYLSHIIFSALIRIVLLKFGIENFATHFLIGVAGGMCFPLFSIPFYILLYNRWPLFSKAMLPIKLPEHLNSKKLTF